MGAAVGLREDFGADELRRLAAKVKDAAQARRLLALAAVRDGMNRTEAARIGGMTGRRCGTGRTASTSTVLTV